MNTLNEHYKDYYILLETNLLGDKFDIIKCLSTRAGWTIIDKANGQQHAFAASIQYGLDNNWFIPFSHVNFTKLHVEAALKAAAESKALCTMYTEDGLDYQENTLCKESILNAYPLTNII